jgi:CBS domain-containing protein
MTRTGSYLDAIFRHPRKAHEDQDLGCEAPRPRRRTRRVQDVMTTPVVTADRITPYKEVARLLAEHQISGLPVLTMSWQVVGVISEADLLAAEGPSPRGYAPGRSRRLHRHRHTRLTAGELMTTPAVTINCDATTRAAARVMTTHHVRRLPVTGADGQLIGIVSRRDLLSVFLRPDADIITDVRQILDEIPLAEPAAAIVMVRYGVVTLTGTIMPVPGRPEDLVQLATRMIWDVDGVVDIVNGLYEVKGSKPSDGGRRSDGGPGGW